MNTTLKYKRILLKLSGEVLANRSTGECIDPANLAFLAERVKKIHALGCQVGIVLGGGNIFRGLSGADKGVNRVTGDSMGMLATIINGLAMMNALEALGVPTRVMTSIDMPKIAALFNDALGTTLGATRNGSYEPTPSTAFGEAPPRTGAAPPETFFTGKPFIADLGHTFLLRNYRATLGKWQTADPLGYPDGWNQMAYCNNESVSAIDLMGGDIYHLLDPNGAGGAGHSVWVIGNRNSGFSAFDYQANGLSGSGSSGSSSNSESNTGNGFDTVCDAKEFLNNTRDENHKFTRMQKWTTSPEEDRAAIEAANVYMGQDYSLLFHNCYQLGSKAIFPAINALRDSGQIDFSNNPYPKKAFDQNNARGALHLSGCE